MHRNLPCDAGRAIGSMISRMADAEVPAYETELRHEGRIEIPERCSTCAFRLGTLPNSCLSTTADALKCTLEFVDFLCHDRKAETPAGKQVCVGWAMLVSKTIREGGRAIVAPWPFSDEIKEEVPA